MAKIGFKQLSSLLSLLPILLLWLCSHAIAGEGNTTFQPKLKWLFLSSGVYLDKWGGDWVSGNGFYWKPKSRYLNPPQTLMSLTAGGSMSLTSNVGLYLALPVFYNTFDPYKDGFNGSHVMNHRSGVGDLEIGIPIRFKTLTVQPQLAIPGPYDPKYLAPWTGFGVYRASLWVSYGLRSHFVWSSGEAVLYKPTGKYPGMVEPGDYALKGGYGYKWVLRPKLQLKGGIDAASTSFRWQPSAKAQTSFTADPKIAFAYSPFSGHALSATMASTLYSTQGGEPDFRSYASRKLFFGLYWGRYF